MACVLLIDDYAGFREAMDYCLPKFGYVVLSAPDAPTALALAANHAVDVALIDIGLPRFTGLAVCDAIRHDAKLAGVPIVVMTGLMSAEITARARAAGAAEVVAKPFQWPHLLAVLRAVAPGAR
jgi:CheY-like chemotaxis protein